MAGTYTASLPLRLKNADKVVFLDLGRLHCLGRVLACYWHYKGGNRPELPPGCPEKIDLDFVKWIWFYLRWSNSRIMAALANSAVGNLVILKGLREIDAFLEKLNPG